jgi:hypothetical protein
MLGKNLPKGVALLAFVLTCLAVQGCYTRVRLPVRVHRAEVEHLPPEPEFELSISIEPVKFRIGDPVTLRIYVHNPHRRRIEKTFPSGCNVSYQVWGPNGNVVGPYRVCNAFGSSIGLDPDETRVVERTWPYKGKYFTSSGELVPGKYWIQAGFVWGMKFEGETDAVLVEVLPRRVKPHPGR